MFLYKSLFVLLIFLSSFIANKSAQAQYPLNKSRIHSHNDYEQKIPLYAAFQANAYSVEIDVFLSEDSHELYVAHSRDEIKATRTLSSLYLKPLQAVYKRLELEETINEARTLQLLIDIKSEWESTLPILIEKLTIIKSYIDKTDQAQIQIVITGDIPPSKAFKEFPDWVYFDGRLNRDYNEIELSKVAMFSAPFSNYTKWGGKGRPLENEHQAIVDAINYAHKLGKPIRFWGTPDSKTTWEYLVANDADYINTDKPTELNSWLTKRVSSISEKSSLTINHSLNKIVPSERGNVKNVILFIIDGMGLAQLHAAQTVVGGSLNITKSSTIGLVKTQAYDAYSTDSAAGATAFSTGVKTNNRALGVDSSYKSNTSILELFAKKGYKTAIITTDSFDGATPAAFYAHQNDRDNYDSILNDLQQSPLNGIISTGSRREIKSGKYDWITPEGVNFSSFDTQNKQAIFINENIDPDWLAKTMIDNLTMLDESENGFFLVVEGAKVDNGGHANDLNYLVNELVKADNAVGEILQWSSLKNETLVIVTADHETGGLVIYDGNENDGIAIGHFYSNDHTGIMVPLFAFGPNSRLFNGVYENTQVYFKILKAMGFE